MPWPSKRKRQLENAREVKRQKQQPGEEQQNPDVHDNDESAPDDDFSDADGQDRCPEGDVLDEGDPQLEGEGIVYDEEVSRADSDAEDKDVIEEYAEDWVGGLDRDDLRSLSILLHYLLVCLLQMGITGASKLIAEDLDPPQPEVIAKTIVLFHDESTFQANDYECTQWGTKNDHMLVPKSRGAGIMVSDFISEESGYLSLTDEEFAAGRKKYPQLKQFARSSIEYGENLASWNSLKTL